MLPPDVPTLPMKINCVIARWIALLIMEDGYEAKINAHVYP